MNAERPASDSSLGRRAADGEHRSVRRSRHRSERGELALQRRWAEARWPGPFLHLGRSRSSDRAGDATHEEARGGTRDEARGGTHDEGRAEAGQPIRVITSGRWNHGPGPDFRGAQILDATGRARRGDVEFHLRPNDWIQHGHNGDAAYDDVLLHIVEHDGARRGKTAASGSTDPRVPEAVVLPPAESIGAPRMANALPCDSILRRAGRLAVESRLERIAERRFGRKMRELYGLDVPHGPGSERDRRMALAAARALGQPHNAAAALLAMHDACCAAARWSELRVQIDTDGWRRGRGALGSPEGLARILETLVGRWSKAGRSPWTAALRLAELPISQAIDALRIPKLLGSGRATQLLADAVYPLTGARERWFALPAVRYQRSDALRERLDDGLRWRHPHSQALLELEQTRCRQGACRICPLAALGDR